MKPNIETNLIRKFSDNGKFNSNGLRNSFASLNSQEPVKLKESTIKMNKFKIINSIPSIVNKDGTKRLNDANKLTFDSVFNKAVYIKPNSSLVDKIQTGRVHTSSYEPNLKSIGTTKSTEILNSINRINQLNQVKNRIPKPQISISINNFNISNFNFPRLHSSNQGKLPEKISHRIYNKDLIQSRDSQVSIGDSSNKNKHSSLTKLTKDKKIKDMPINPHQGNKIENLIDGNDDSFVDELAHLLNTVNENKPNGLDEEVVPDPRINFEELQILNSKRPQTSYGGISARQRSLWKNTKFNEEQSSPKDIS